LNRNTDNTKDHNVFIGVEKRMKGKKGSSAINQEYLDYTRHLEWKKRLRENQTIQQNPIFDHQETLQVPLKRCRISHSCMYFF